MYYRELNFNSPFYLLTRDNMKLSYNTAIYFVDGFIANNVTRLNISTYLIKQDR